MELTTEISLIAGGVYLLAGILKGTLGIGFPTAVIVMMAMMVDPRTAILLATIPMIATNVWQVIRCGRFVESVEKVWPLAITMIIFIIIFTRISTGLPVERLTLFLGAAVAIFAITSLWADPPALPEKYNLIAQITTGVIAGVMGGIAAIWAPALIVYLTAKRIQKDEFVAIVGFLLMAGSITLFSTLWSTGVVLLEHVKMSSLLVVPSIAGFMIGESLRSRVSNDTFRKLMLWFFLLMGLNLVWRGLIA